MMLSSATILERWRHYRHRNHFPTPTQLTRFSFQTLFIDYFEWIFYEKIAKSNLKSICVISHIFFKILSRHHENEKKKSRRERNVLWTFPFPPSCHSPSTYACSAISLKLNDSLVPLNDSLHFSERQPTVGGGVLGKTLDAPKSAAIKYKWARFWRRRENMEKTQRKTQTREARATRKYAISSQNQIAIMTEIAWISFHCSLSYVVKLLRGRWDFHEISPPNPLNPTLLNQRTSANRQKSWVNYLILAQLIILLYLITQFMVSNK